MKPFAFLIGVAFFTIIHANISMAQPASPQIEDIAMVPRLTIRSELGVTNAIEYAEEVATNQWLVLTNFVVTNNPYFFVDLDAPTSPKRFYRVVIPGLTNEPPDTSPQSRGKAPRMHKTTRVRSNGPKSCCSHFRQFAIQNSDIFRHETGQNSVMTCYIGRKANMHERPDNINLYGI